MSARTRRTAAAVAASSVLALGGLLVAEPGAHATPAPPPASTASLTGTGKVLGSAGATAKVDAVVTCAKGESWSLTGVVFAFAEVGRDDTFASVDPQSGKCTGKPEKVKIGLTVYHNPPIPRNCSAEYDVTFSFSDGTSVNIDRGGAVPVPGPQVCLS